MSEHEPRQPVRGLDDLAHLDVEEIIEGYRDGFGGEMAPGANKSRAYWHGWRNGIVDGGHSGEDEAMSDLARVYLAAARVMTDPAG